MCISRSQVWSRATERDVWKLGFTSVNFGVQGPRGAGRGWVWEKKGSGFEPVLQLSEAGLPRGASPFWPTAYYWWGWERFSSHLFKGWLNIDPDWSLRIILMESGVGGSMGELPWRESLCLSSVTPLGRQGCWGFVKRRKDSADTLYFYERRLRVPLSLHTRHICLQAGCLLLRYPSIVLFFFWMF